MSQFPVSDNVRDVAPSSSFDPSSLLFPFSASGFSSLPPPPLSFLLPFSSSSAPSFSTLAPLVPPVSVPIFSLPSVVPSVLSVSSAPLPAVFLHPLSPVLQVCLLLLLLLSLLLLLCFLLRLLLPPGLRRLLLFPLLWDFLWASHLSLLPLLPGISRRFRLGC